MLSPRVPAWASRALRDAYDGLRGEFGAREHGEQMTLAPGVYRALKFAGRNHGEK